MLLAQLEINLDMAAYALKTAKKLGVATILNPAPATPLSSDMMQLADYLTPNETELETLSGQAGQDATARARSLLTRDGQTAVVTLGAQGAQIVSQNQSVRLETFEVDVVDTTGAGDAFNAGLAVALAEGKDLRAAVRFANATAALSVTKPGTARSAPRRAEVDALIAERGL